MADMPVLLADLDAFYLEHGRCGELESEISEGEPAWMGWPAAAALSSPAGSRTVSPIRAVVNGKPPGSRSGGF
jgi:hypothetical protein